MENKELYEKTVSILVKAYQNDTLVHGDCCACAVGNMVAYNCGFEIRKPSDRSPFVWKFGENAGMFPSWKRVFVTIDNSFQNINPENYEFDAKVQIDSTGYSYENLAKIEHAFEMAPMGLNDDCWMFNGLMAVIDVLDQIHKNTDPIVTKSTKERFIKQLS